MRARPSTNSLPTTVILPLLSSVSFSLATNHPLTQFFCRRFLLLLLPRRVQRTEFCLRFLTHNSTSQLTFFARLFKHARFTLFTLSNHTVRGRLTARKGNPKIYHGVVAAAAVVTAKVFVPPTTLASQSVSVINVGDGGGGGRQSLQTR